MVARPFEGGRTLASVSRATETSEHQSSSPGVGTVYNFTPKANSPGRPAFAFDIAISS
jgi:hypothetical protein